MKVLLSIKPEYADKIFNGTKLFEFRRSIFKNPDIKTVVVYASSPVQKVIGEFDIESILHESIDELWRLASEHGGVQKQFFFDYFSNKDSGFAIKIRKTRRYKIAKNLESEFKVKPPQNFLYL
jgi:predicted transcriptional regulator